MKIIAILLSISIFITGCASSVANPVPVAQVGDETKSCDAIANEMQKMVTAQVEADGDKDKQIGTNAALGVTGIFLLGIPWFFMDLGGAASAEQKAAKARFERLQQMQIDKKCPASPIVVEQEVKGGENITITETPSNKPSNPSPARASLIPPSAVNDSPNPAKKLEDLNTMLKKGLITQDEYNAKKTQILNSM
uniref:SHOCT domain-containing protein n=1 Tax=Polynucleobacter sp. TaxID=2029855 RepID=UPI0040487DEB